MANETEAAAFASLIKEHGQQFDPIPPDTRLAMCRATTGVINHLKASIGANLVDRAISEAGRRTVAHDKP